MLYPNFFSLAHCGRRRDPDVRKAFLITWEGRMQAQETFCHGKCSYLLLLLYHVLKNLHFHFLVWFSWIETIVNVVQVTCPGSSDTATPSLSLLISNFIYIFSEFGWRLIMVDVILPCTCITVCVFREWAT